MGGELLLRVNLERFVARFGLVGSAGESGGHRSFLVVGLESTGLTLGQGDNTDGSAGWKNLRVQYVRAPAGVADDGSWHYRQLWLPPELLTVAEGGRNRLTVSTGDVRLHTTTLPYTATEQLQRSPWLPSSWRASR